MVQDIAVPRSWWYSIGIKPSFLIIGLGNPGRSYEGTRHNAGFAATDVLGDVFGAGEWMEREKFQGMVREAHIDDVPVLLLKPVTYMNLSGTAIRKVTDFFQLDPASQILVCCDDVDLPLGTVRLRVTGGPGTHNGLKSVVEHYGEAFPRLRIGIGPKPIGVDLAAWVLSRMTEEERHTLEKTLRTLPEMLRSFVHDRTDS